MQKLIRLTTISASLNSFVEGQLCFLSQYYEVIGVASGKELLEKVEAREGIRVVEVPMSREINLWQDLKSLCLLIQLFHRERPNIVHANTPKGSLLAMIAAWITRVPHRIYTVTGLRFETSVGTFRKILILMERITCLCATKVIPEGDGVKNTLLREKITRKPLKKILNGNINGVNLKHFARTPKVLDEAKGLRTEDVFTFCFVGRIVKDKGINELVSAFVSLYDENNDIHLLLLGNFENELDPLLPETEDLILHHSGINFLGYQEDIRPFLAASDAFIFPSYREGFPNVVMQAGAIGLPSIVTDISGCNEIITEGENGIIIPPKNERALFEAMKRFINEPQFVAAMAGKAREMITSRYEQREVWNAILQEYKSLSTPDNKAFR